MAQRITYRRRKSFNTKSNKIRQVKTPGGKLAVQYLQKRPRGVMCGDCKTKLQGVRAAPPPARGRAGTPRRRVNPRSWRGAARVPRTLLC